MGILDSVEAELADFHPRTPSEFAALQIARRFDDLRRLPRYVLAAKRHSKRMLLDAARTAVLRYQLNRTPTADLFFEILAEREEAQST
jgi:hypothetical protein